jgi:F-type H+-transporting ATPase subunit delta
MASLSAVVESRYASALLDAAPTAKDADTVLTDMSRLTEIWSDSEELRYFLLNPTVPNAAKKETLTKILAQDAPAVLKNFVCLLTDKGRLEELPKICGEYKRIKDARQNNLEIAVYSAQPLDEAQLKQICDKYKLKYAASSAAVTNIVDSSLIGGICVRVGDDYVDDTLAGRLKGLLSVIKI